MKIGITGDLADSAAVRQCEGWLLRFNPLIDFVELTRSIGGPAAVEACDGLFLTGGGDIHPRRYGLSDDGKSFRGVDERRDEAEFAVLGQAMVKGIPVFGICRGLQTVNVFLGGSLFADLEARGFEPHTPIGDQDRRHEVVISPGSLLGGIEGRTRGSVNSSHHQGVDRIGRGLVVSARSEDGVVEALERDEQQVKPFLLLVQWHPERMKDSTNPLAEGVARTFLEETRTHGNQKRH